MEHLIARAKEDVSQQAGASLLTAPEAEHIIETLRSFGLDQVGSPEWRAQHGQITTLNLQAHHNAQTHSDEFVKSALVSLDKFPVLVRELVTFEVWKANVLPLLQQHVAEQVDSMTSYMLLQHEAAVANLLEITLYHQEACEAVDEDSLLELCDWGYRKLLSLNSKVRKQHKVPGGLFPCLHLHALTRPQKHESWHGKIANQQVAEHLACCDYLNVLPLALLTRLVTTNDTLMALVPLLEDPPWVRRRNKKTEKFIGNVWTAIESRDRLKLTQHDAQVWLMLNNLLVDPKARAKYDMDEYRKKTVLRVRRHMNDILLDQLPILKDLQRVLDELTMGVSSQQDESQTTRLIIEQVPVMRDALLKQGNWQQVADKQRQAFFSRAASAQQSKRQMDDMLKALDFMCNLQPDKPQAPAGHEANQTEVRFELWRKVKEGVFERWEEHTCGLNPAKPAEPVSIEAEGSAGVQGLRHRLQAVEAETGRAFPANGKIVVKFGGRSAEALLELPAPSTRDGAAELPAVVWLTAGLLATDTFALQLKLKRAEKPKTRDKAAGVWYIYHAVGGAITVLNKE
ncbi:MAG: zinc finger MYND domain-containing 10-like [Trebouxia sp. A1-2]|nr:MAG: zinc finger MYND domain-containing 10-like [Trebouxia sp. A1-2]